MSKPKQSAWRVHEGDDYIVVLNSKRHRVMGLMEHPTPRNRRDARMIAAAPRMANAIRAAAMKASADDCIVQIPRSLYDELENALDAATGEYSRWSPK